MGNSSGNIERLKKMRRPHWFYLVFPLACAVFFVVFGLFYLSGKQAALIKGAEDVWHFRLLGLIMGIGILSINVIGIIIASLGITDWMIRRNFAIVAEEIENIKRSIRLQEGKDEQKEQEEK